MAWTTEMVNKLEKMWQSGLTTNEIAKQLGVSKNSVVGKVHRLSLIARPSPIKKKDEEDELPLEEPAKKSPKPKKEESNKAPSYPSNPAPVKEEKPIKTKGCIKLSELNNHTCRWPIGDPKDDHFCFCGNKVRAGQTYCDEHAAIAYVKPVKK